MMMHTHFEGEKLARERNPFRITLAGRIMIASLAVAMIGTLFAMIINHLEHAETAFRLAARV